MTPPGDLEDPLREITRDLRRTTYLATAIELAASEVREALEHTTDPARALLAVLHRHLALAWDDGAGREADLRSALDVARATIARLRSARRLSDPLGVAHVAFSSAAAERAPASARRSSWS